MDSAHEPALTQVVSAVLDSKKYRAVAPSLVAAIAAAELTKGRSIKEAVKATKSQLHQSAAAYQSARMDYDLWLADLRQAYTAADPAEPKATLQRILAHHASTQERIPFLDEFYTEIFAHLPPIQSILDVACGLNPLACAWMPIPPTVRYTACDIYQDQIAFLNNFFEIAGVSGVAEVRDVVYDPPTQPVDLALVLKTIPCLEQIDRQAGARLLASLNAHSMVVSFPVRSLGGRNKGMSTHYERYFRDLVRDQPWQVRQLSCPGELTFLLTT